jgi:hypothetical protein
MSPAPHLNSIAFPEKFGSSGKWIGDAVQKRHDFIGCGKKIKPTTGDKAMSNSMLYHTFGITSVQHINTLF